MNDTSKTVAKGSDRVNDVLDGIKDKSEELLEDAKEQGTKLWEKAQDRGQDAWKDTKTWISKHPGAAVGYSFLAGALIYALFGRKED